MLNVMGVFSKRHASEALSLPDFSCILKKSELHFVVVVLYLMFIYYHKRLSSIMH